MQPNGLIIMQEQQGGTQSPDCPAGWLQMPNLKARAKRVYDSGAGDAFDVPSHAHRDPKRPALDDAAHDLHSRCLFDANDWRSDVVIQEGMRKPMELKDLEESQRFPKGA